LRDTDDAAVVAQASKIAELLRATDISYLWVMHALSVTPCLFMFQATTPPGDGTLGLVTRFVLSRGLCYWRELRPYHSLSPFLPPLLFLKTLLLLTQSKPAAQSTTIKTWHAESFRKG
jgi:hypothetical protein